MLHGYIDAEMGAFTSATDIQNLRICWYDHGQRLGAEFEGDGTKISPTKSSNDLFKEKIQI